MKISIGYKVQQGPWGGGNGFYAGLIQYLQTAGYQVVQNLDDDDIDIILVTDPRRRNNAIPFTYNAAWRYARYKNPSCLLVHRINECDERKNTNSMNRLLKQCNAVMDHTVFVGTWLKELDLWQGIEKMPYSVILNGSDSNIFNSVGLKPWTGDGPLKLITHHWGGNWMKGFDIYQRLDQMLAEDKWRGRIEFSYMGNLPVGFQFNNTTFIEPKSGKDLADELRNHHAYVTGSIGEPGGNHQNEGAQCGLPVLFLRSGCMTEYLDEYGVGYNSIINFEEELEKLLRNYTYWQKKITSYPNTLKATCLSWETLFLDLFRNREELISLRAKRETFDFRLRHRFSL